MSQGPSLVTQDTPIGNPGPFQAGGQAPPIHWVTDSQQGEFNGIPGQFSVEAPEIGCKPIIPARLSRTIIFKGLRPLPPTPDFRIF